MNGKNKLYRKICMIMAALVGTGALLSVLWYGGTFLPRWIVWESGAYSVMSGEYEIVLKCRAVSIIYDNGVIWTSPKGVRVQEALSGDVDNDGREELILLCWKIGRYGRSKPFWVEKDEKKWSQHIFVYEYDEEKVKPKWMSSYIGQDVAAMACGQDLYEREDKEKLVTGMPDKLFLTDRDGKVSRWAWDSWGFAKEETAVSFAVFGDNLIHEPIYQYGLHNDKDFCFLYKNMEDMIAQKDVAVINQETPLTDDPSRYSGYPRFGTPVQVGEAISDAGFDVVTCATNHALDQGAEGIGFTKNFFGFNGMLCLGIQTVDEKEYQPYIVLVRNGIRFALLNYTYGTNGHDLPAGNPNMVHLLEDEDQVRADLEKARAESDFVIVFVHWGTEYEEQPDDGQKRWAQLFLESKADVVIGTHPHALQPYEILKDDSGHEMLVYYSIGNYISAQPEKSCVKGGMAEFTVSLTDEGYQVTEYGLCPLKIIWQEGGKYMVEFGE